MLNLPQPVIMKTVLLAVSALHAVFILAVTLELKESNFHQLDQSEVESDLKYLEDITKYILFNFTSQQIFFNCLKVYKLVFGDFLIRTGA